MEYIPSKEILSPLPQNLSSVGINTLELPIILSIPTGSPCNSAASSMAAHACSPDLHRFLELVPQKSFPVVPSISFLLGCSLKFCFHSFVLPTTLLKSWMQCLAPVLLPYFSSYTDSFWLVGCGSADRSSRPVLVCLKEEISCFSSTETEYPQKWMNWFISVLQENNKRNTSQSLNWLPDSPS